MILFFTFAIISIIAQFAVNVNYNMIDYLPEGAPATEAMELMEDEFSGGLADTRVLLKDVTIPEALQFKAQLEAIEGVSDVIWLDDAVDVTIPLEMADEDVVATYYKDGNALFMFAIESGKEVSATDQIYELIGPDHALAGEAVNTATQQKMTFSETMLAATILIPVVIIILILSTTSWVEPIFYLVAIGVSVLINLGTNIFLGEISFVTQAVAPILQLAVSLDYAIFLLHSFADYRTKVEDVSEAMQLAIKRSFPAIFSSASTTFLGFLALSFMQFEIGADLGFNLMKGIAFSFISVMVFLPALTLIFYRWIDKTQHRSFLPKLNKIGRRIIQLRVPVMLLVILLIIPTFLAQSKIDFTYGFGEQAENLRVGADKKIIEEQFGKNTQVVILVPKGDLAKEDELVSELENLPYVKSVLAYVNAVSPAIPPEYLAEDVTESFYSENYSRIIVHTNTDVEGDIAFGLYEKIMATTKQYYEEAHFVGEIASLYDMKNVILKDNRLVNTLTVLTIALVIMVVYRSISFPVVLLLTIQASVWINLSMPYFTQTALVYIGYLIISTVQLAATIDYAVLLSEDYTKKRQVMPAKEAIIAAINEKTFSIMVSASILSSVGFILAYTSSNPIVLAIGMLLGRGALLAFILVICFLPGLLIMFDKWIEKTTWNLPFYKEDQS